MGPQLERDKYSFKIKNSSLNYLAALKDFFWRNTLVAISAADKLLEPLPLHLLDMRVMRVIRGTVQDVSKTRFRYP